MEHSDSLTWDFRTLIMKDDTGTYILPQLQICLELVDLLWADEEIEHGGFAFEFWLGGCGGHGMISFVRKTEC